MVDSDKTKQLCLYCENIKEKTVFYAKDRRRIKKKHFPFWRSAFYIEWFKLDLSVSDALPEAVPWRHC